ncbi:hypothetical protein MM236_16890 [Belliella sp. DSM 107340]|uniref:Uncharacterized protein n=1 Tax=Belliella calami TaxID=2923436 RepID=A0ABS9USS1_9BACT|nr:hypothetical protein [Belliella calami]MCH7399677.1 hypothetical protein [Belliella calami]
MRKISLLLVVLVICSLNFAKAQMQVLRDQATGNPVMTNSYPEVKGSQYWKEFDKGSILFTEKDTANEVVIAFNAFNHTLEYREGRDLKFYSPGRIKGFVLNSESSPQFYVSGYDIPNVGSNRFVELLVHGNYTLVNHKYKIMNNDPGATYGSQRAKAFSNVEDLYVFKDGKAFLWKIKKKGLVEFFGADVFALINQLSEKYTLDLKEKNDIRRLIMLMNSGNN